MIQCSGHWKFLGGLLFEHSSFILRIYSKTNSWWEVDPWPVVAIAKHARLVAAWICQLLTWCLQSFHS